MITAVQVLLMRARYHNDVCDVLHWQVRAISPAGNRDPYILERNSFSWTYVPALPWLLIILAIAIVGMIIAAIIMYIRRRRRRLALEKYALKRKRRKLRVRALCCTAVCLCFGPIEIFKCFL